jgi:hypothetical protein
MSAFIELFRGRTRQRTLNGERAPSKKPPQLDSASEGSSTFPPNSMEDVRLAARLESAHQASANTIWAELKDSK